MDQRCLYTRSDREICPPESCLANFGAMDFERGRIVTKQSSCPQEWLRELYIYVCKVSAFNSKLMCGTNKGSYVRSVFLVVPY